MGRPIVRCQHCNIFIRQSMRNLHVEKCLEEKERAEDIRYTTALEILEQAKLDVRVIERNDKYPLEKVFTDLNICPIWLFERRTMAPIIAGAGVFSNPKKVPGLYFSMAKKQINVDPYIRKKVSAWIYDGEKFNSSEVRARRKQIRAKAQAK